MGVWIIFKFKVVTFGEADVSAFVNCSSHTDAIQQTVFSHEDKYLGLWLNITAFLHKHSFTINDY